MRLLRRLIVALVVFTAAGAGPPLIGQQTPTPPAASQEPQVLELNAMQVLDRIEKFMNSASKARA